PPSTATIASCFPPNIVSPLGTRKPAKSMPGPPAHRTSAPSEDEWWRPLGRSMAANLDGDVETIARTSHLLLPFPDTIRNDMAFHDRWHAYLPGWEMPKMQPDYFASHMGFIADYIAEIFHNELRMRSYAD